MQNESSNIPNDNNYSQTLKITRKILFARRILLNKKRKQVE